MKKTMLSRTLITASLLLLSGCDIPGFGPDPRIAKREADAKAIGSACRHGLRGIEDCYKQNEDASKSDIFTGWKDMDQYMRENKIEGVTSPVSKVPPVEEIIEPNKAKPGIEAKEKPVVSKPVASEKPGATAASAGKVPASAPAKASASH